MQFDNNRSAYIFFPIYNICITIGLSKHIPHGIGFIAFDSTIIIFHFYNILFA